MQEIVVLKNFTRKFSSHTVAENVSITIEQGEIVGLIGSNGAGKSVIMKTIAGTLAPTAGTLHICGINVFADPIRAKNKIGYLPEHLPVYPDMTPYKFLSFLTELKGFSKKERKNIIDALSNDLEINDIINKPIKNLSLSGLKLIGIAQALIHNPDLILLDNPFVGLDYNNKQKIIKILKNLTPQKTILINTNDLIAAEEACSRIVIMDKGQIIQDDILENILTKTPFHNSTTVRIPIKNIENAKKALSELNEIDEIYEKHCKNDVLLTITSNNNAMLAPKILVNLKNHKINVKSFLVNNGTLEEVFKKFIKTNEYV